jgi:hypothetical protein
MVKIEILVKKPGVRLMLVEYNYSLNLIMLHAVKII